MFAAQSQAVDTLCSHGSVLIKGVQGPGFQILQKPILATLCLAHWHSDPVLLRLWTQSSEKPYRFFKHIISGWGFRNITNHLKVLVQCGSIIPGSRGPIYRLGHCKKFPVNSTTTLYHRFFSRFYCWRSLNPHRCLTLLWKQYIFFIWIEWKLHNYFRVVAGLCKAQHLKRDVSALPSTFEYVLVFHCSHQDKKKKKIAIYCTVASH